MVDKVVVAVTLTVLLVVAVVVLVVVFGVAVMVLATVVVLLGVGGVVLAVVGVVLDLVVVVAVGLVVLFLKPMPSEVSNQRCKSKINFRLEVNRTTENVGRAEQCDQMCRAKSRPSSSL